MRILVAENDARARWALQMLLGQEPGLAIAECADLGSLVAQVEAFKPDLVLLDWELPGRPAAALLFALNGPAVNPGVIVLSRRPESEEAALAAGAEAFVSKADPPAALLSALRRLARDCAGDGATETPEKGEAYRSGDGYEFGG
jgi:DNA-binding response OmpR family regulator